MVPNALTIIDRFHLRHKLYICVSYDFQVKPIIFMNSIEKMIFFLSRIWESHGNALNRTHPHSENRNVMFRPGIDHVSGTQFRWFTREAIRFVRLWPYSELFYFPIRVTCWTQVVRQWVDFIQRGICLSIYLCTCLAVPGLTFLSVSYCLIQAHPNRPDVFIIGFSSRRLFLSN